MILIIRIAGHPETDKDIREGLFRLRLHRKYSAVLVKETEENMKLIQHIRNFIAYGPINAELLGLLVEKRGKSIDKKKFDYKKVVDAISKNGLNDNGIIKPYFRLHPPKGGIDSKLHAGKKKGVLGDNKDKINDL